MKVRVAGTCGTFRTAVTSAGHSNVVIYMTVIEIET